MGNKKIKNTLFSLLICFQSYSQTDWTHKDSIAIPKMQRAIQHYIDSMNISKNLFINLKLDSVDIVKLTEFYFVREYGNSKYQEEMPMRYILLDDIWYIYGTLGQAKKENAVRRGGTMHMMIDRRTGTVINIYHER